MIALSVLAELNKEVKLVAAGQKKISGQDLYELYQVAIMKVKTIKINSKGLVRPFTKVSTPEYYPPYIILLYGNWSACIFVPLLFRFCTW